MSGSVDTNVLLRLILDDVPAQRDQAEQLLAGARHPIGVADIVFVEVEYALRVYYKVSREDIVKVLLSLANHPKLNCNRSHLIETARLYGELQGVSYTDIALNVCAELTDQTPLWTYDKNLAKKLPNAKLLG